jgi:diguanylate cyclase (GGDEF)-like protein
LQPKADGSILRVSVSVGIAVKSGDDLVAGQLMNDADVALYEAKRDGRNCVRLAKAPVEQLASIA